MVQEIPVAYFNNAGKTWSPPSVLDAGIQALHFEAQPWKRPPESLDQITLEVRQLFASLIHSTTSDCIAICPSTGFSITMIAHNIARSFVKKKDNDDAKILVLQDEMSSEIYPWQEVFPCSLEIVSYPSNTSSWEQDILDKIQLLKHDIAAVCIPQVHWADGSIVGLEGIGTLCQEYSIPLVVDGTQSVGIMPLNVQQIACDALVVSTHKWLLGPRGTCLVYIHPRHHSSWTPLDQHERSRMAFQNEELMDAVENSISSPCGYPEDFVPGAARLDSGGKKNLVLLSMVREGLKMVTNLNLEQAQIQLSQMTASIIQQVEDLGFYVRPGSRAGHILGLRPISTSTWTPNRLLELCQQLKNRNIFVAIRHGAIRISPYLHTSVEEVYQLIQGLKELVEDMIYNNSCMYF